MRVPPRAGVGTVLLAEQIGRRALSRRSSCVRSPDTRTDDEGDPSRVSHLEQAATEVGRGAVPRAPAPERSNRAPASPTGRRRERSGAKAKR
jgi:hypothetical protein